jgi:hypothetical protein
MEMFIKDISLMMSFKGKGSLRRKMELLLPVFLEMGN